MLNPWHDRIVHEVAYATQLSKTLDGKYDKLIDSVCDYLIKMRSEHGAITKESAIHAEHMLKDVAPDAKRFSILCAAHAHIDMNWMWGWDETVAVTLDTFRTMLTLMNEYPEFVFSQSQASTYRIVEQYSPEMLQEIRERVQEGRWEVTASTWVEPDKNMPNGESLARHALYTKKYLADLFDLNPHDLNIDFEPDTFGHSAQTPEILVNSGVRYYYHCRGYDGHNLYRWFAPSNSSVLVYREPIWYNGAIDAEMALHVPEFCTQHHMTTMLKVYGVGDHGGGPTRRDIERIMEMNTWPIFPNIRFGKFRDFFSLMDEVEDQLPEVRGELNFVFTGCYTSQSRIKKANRVAEATLQESEMFEAFSSLENGSPYHAEMFEDAWRNVLFNQFHDIIPGSGVIETREYAMGLFQHAMAIANTSRTLAMRRIASSFTTSAVEDVTDELKETAQISQGAGVGFGLKDFKVFQSEQGYGKKRVFYVFNAAPFERDEAAEIVVWDWHGSADSMMFTNESGKVADHQILDSGTNHYWGHHYIRVLVRAVVPACGFAALVLTDSGNGEAPVKVELQPRVERVIPYVLENDYVKVTFDSRTGSLRSMIDKKAGEELVRQDSLGGVFRWVLEDESRGMTAWTVGRHMNVKPLMENVRITPRDTSTTDLRQSITLRIPCGESSVRVEVSLAYDSPTVEFDVECNWKEIGKQGFGIPQLSYYIPLAYKCSEYKYDVPFGVVCRPELDLDVPANSFAAAMRSDTGGKSVMLMTDCKYGFRCIDDSLSVTLIRSSFEPDPYPEIGIHKFRFAVSTISYHEGGNLGLIRRAYRMNHPLSPVTSTSRPKSVPSSASYFSIEDGSVALSAIKRSEHEGAGAGTIIRVYETDGVNTEAVLRVHHAVKRVRFVDFNEETMTVDDDSVIIDENNRIRFGLPAYRVVTLWAEFESNE